MPDPKAETKQRPETVMNAIRKEAQKIRESNERLRDLIGVMASADRPAPAQVLSEGTTTIAVGLTHLKGVFTEF